MGVEIRPGRTMASFPGSGYLPQLEQGTWAGRGISSVTWCDRWRRCRSIDVQFQSAGTTQVRVSGRLRSWVCRSWPAEVLESLAVRVWVWVRAPGLISSLLNCKSKRCANFPRLF